MKIGFISTFDVCDKSAWSGTINFLYETLKNEYDIYPIVVKLHPIQKIISRITKIIICGKRKFTMIDQFFNKINVKHNIKKAQKNGVDVFFAPAASTLLGVANIPANCKVIYLSDATYHCMINYYYFNENQKDIKKFNSMEKNSLYRADEIIFSSDWAKQDAIKYYGVDEKKIHVLPFGANLDDKYIEHNIGDIIKILFVGVEWERKGADLAIECINILNNKNYKKKFELTLIGLDKPKQYVESEFVHFVGKLNKNNREEFRLMISYYQNSDIFLLPTKAECAGIVFSEASMYGLPIFTHNTGGISSYVDDRKMGRTLKLGSTGKDFADAILEMLINNKYQEWSKNSRQKFESELNWKCWFDNCKKIIG